MPICLPEAGRDPSPGTQAYVAGWGTTISEETNGPLIPVLASEIKRPSLLQVISLILKVQMTNILIDVD